MATPAPRGELTTEAILSKSEAAYQATAQTVTNCRCGLTPSAVTFLLESSHSLWVWQHITDLHPSYCPDRTSGYGSEQGMRVINSYQIPPSSCSGHLCWLSIKEWTLLGPHPTSSTWSSSSIGHTCSPPRSSACLFQDQKPELTRNQITSSGLVSVAVLRLLSLFHQRRKEQKGITTQKALEKARFIKPIFM